MKLTYTVEIDVGPMKDDAVRAAYSTKLVKAALGMVGRQLRGRTIRHVSIWPHENAAPSLPKGTAPLPAEHCPTCGTPRFDA